MKSVSPGVEKRGPRHIAEAIDAIATVVGATRAAVVVAVATTPTAVASVEVSTSMIAAGGIKLLEFMLEPLLLLPELGKFAGRVVD